MKQEDLAFYGIFAQRLEEIHDMMLCEIQAILDGIVRSSAAGHEIEIEIPEI